MPVKLGSAEQFNNLVIAFVVKFYGIKRTQMIDSSRRYCNLYIYFMLIIIRYSVLHWNGYTKLPTIFSRTDLGSDVDFYLFLWMTDYQNTHFSNTLKTYIFPVFLKVRKYIVPLFIWYILYLYQIRHGMKRACVACIQNS